MTGSGPQRTRAARKRRRSQWRGFLYIAPAMALVIVFFVMPVLFTGWMSLHNWPLMGAARWIGFANYIRMWNDSRFMAALNFTAYYTVIVTIAIFAVAFPLAIFVEKERRFVSTYRTIIFLPVVVGLATASLLWVWLANVDSGFFGPALRALGLDAVVVVAYGLLLPKGVLEASARGAFNLHGSLLPRWRGAAPIQRAIMAGDAVTGVQVMRMTEGLDEGPILLSETVPIFHDDTFVTLHDRMAEVGAELMAGALRALERGPVIEDAQSEEGVTYAHKITSAEARIDWDRPAAEVDRHIRGLSPFPGAWFEALTPKGPVRIKALMSRMAGGQGPAGEVLDDAGGSGE